MMDLSVVSYAGFVHSFENASVSAWVSQDWSAYEGLSFWLYGRNSGTTMFVDVLDNRAPGSTRDDAERWSSPAIDTAGAGCPATDQRGVARPQGAQCDIGAP